MAALDTTYDVVVIGAGIIGLSSALFCRKAGLQVLLLEQFPFPHSRGSSHGATRSTRQAYSESAELSKMMKEGHQLWDLIEAETKTQLRWKTGFVYIEPEPAKNIERLASVNDRYGYDYTLLNDAALKNRYGAVMNFKGCRALLDHEGGLLRADLCCAKILALYKSLGGQFLDSTPITTISAGHTVQVTTKSGTVFVGQKLILAAGSWTGEILKSQLSLDLPLKPEAASVTYWKIKGNPADFQLGAFPCLRDMGTHVYALPSIEYPGLIKLVGPHTNEPNIDPNRRDLNQLSVTDLMKTYGPYLKEHFPKLETPPAIVERCMYTRTPDNLWIVDRHPAHDNIVVLAGFSGHGFKAGPLVGKIASEMVRGMHPENRYNMAAFSISRFSKTARL